MASSSKVMFKLSELKQRAIDSIDLRIVDAQLLVDSYEDDEALKIRIIQWRQAQEERIIELAERVRSLDNSPSDAELSKWEIQSMPSIDRWERARATDRLRSLRGTKSRIEAKSGSLVADENGHIALTKTQLEEFFAL